MKTLKISQAVSYLTNGHVLAHPSESVWGVGVDPLNDTALKKLVQLKGRPPKYGFIVVSSSWRQLEKWLTPLSDKEKRVLEKPTQHPVSWIIPTREALPTLLTGGRESLACRVTKHPTLKNLCEQFGPMVSTSANPHGEHPAKTQAELFKYFGDRVCCLEGNLGSESRPSKIIDLKSQKVIRA